ncbi:uncharacterized protein LOC8268194 [Ricinus communis]|uniref:uncharacterized protein LOC8268194 n=1 Tax=Ricinus communis TaxID=3988 RepID=UPI00201A900D|nr:uncharacterized protein LOC8268194 [Ricinus communis]
MGKLSKQYFQQGQLPKSQKHTKNKKKPVKITYISNPTLVRATNASEFRAIVQELTGKDSKVLDTWDPDPYTTSHEEAASQVPNYESPSSKIDSESVDDAFSSYTSSSLELDDGSFWRNISESFFEFNSPRVFV